jgi:aminoglycoside phosphotransferase (APT) family kinase protein
MTRPTQPDFSDQPTPVRDGQRFDTERLEPWLRAAVPGLPKGAPTVSQFGRGFSNLTYLLSFGAPGSDSRELVLRRAPPGVKIKSAHDMGREFRILSHLASVWQKTPRPLAACDDASLIGTPFYVMDRVRGVILRARVPSGLALDEDTMRRVSAAAIDTLAEIHGIDWRAAGLGDLGKPEGYVERQVTGWAERYRKAQTDEVSQMEELARWLAERRPAEPGDAGATLVHNDFKYDNLVLDEGVSRVEAVLDWEMATIGDPLMDLGTTLGYWIEASDPPVFQVMVFGPTNVPGNLTRAEIVRRYAAKTGRAIDEAGALYYYAFALYKLAVVAQQLYRRYKDGLTKEERYAPMLDGVRAVSSAALVAIEKGRIDRLNEA